jgi:hypothetical protein
VELAAAERRVEDDPEVLAAILALPVGEAVAELAGQGAVALSLVVARQDPGDLDVGELADLLGDREVVPL